MSNRFFSDIEAKLSLLEEKINDLKDQHLHNFYLQSPIPALIADETGVIIEYNSAMTELTGYSHEETPDLKTWLFNIYPDKEYRTKVSKIIKNSRKREPDVTKEEFIITTKAGDQREIEFFFFTIGNNGKSTEFRGIQCLDISEHKRSEKALQKSRDELEQRVGERIAELDAYKKQALHAERWAATGRLAASVAHEINNPLQIIYAHVGFIEKLIPGDSKVTSSTEQIKTAMIRIRNVVKRLLDLHRTQTPQKTKVNIHNSIESALDLLESHFLINKVEVKKQFWSNDIYLENVAQDLHQIFTNLFINALDAMPEGGILEISICIENNKLRIQIQDTGCGIPPEIIHLIFDPYFTTKTTMLGTGLGLSITKGIAESYGGAITVESQAGKGSTFTITFPLSME